MVTSVVLDYMDGSRDVNVRDFADSDEEEMAPWEGTTLCS